MVNYSVKSSYHCWHSANVSYCNISVSDGWNKIWRLNIPRKVKIFQRRFCSNNIPVRNVLRGKGVTLPIVCPMCETDVEHLLHVFFDCNFAFACCRVWVCS